MSNFGFWYAIALCCIAGVALEFGQQASAAIFLSSVFVICVNEICHAIKEKA